MQQPDKKVKFLIIRFSSIGDIVLTTPVIRNLKTQVDHAEVHFLTKEAFKPILEANPYIDKIHTLNKDFSGLMRELKKQNFDYIIDLHRNIRTARVRRYLKRISFAFDKLNLKKWLLVNFKIDRMPAVHIVERYLDTIKLFIEQPDDGGLDYFIPEKDIHVEELPKTDFVVCVLGANHATKQLPVNKMVEVCNEIRKSIVLLGGDAEIEIAAEIEDKTTSEVVNLCGKLSINQSASVISQASWILTPDTGLMHIAAAFGKKIVSVWGNTVPEFGMTPYKPHPDSVLFEQKGLKCRPCSKIGYDKCPKKHFDCMNKHNTGELAQVINK